MRFIGTFLALLLVTSCTETVVEEISLEELIPQSEYDKELAKKDTIHNAAEENIQLPKNLKSIDSILSREFPDVKNVSFHDTTKLFIDRMGFDSKEAFQFNLDPTNVKVIAWKYSDSIQTENAFFNWIDCWGADCKSFRIEESLGLQKGALSIWVGEKVIVFTEAYKNYDYGRLKQIVGEIYGDEWKFELHQVANGRIKWYTSPLEQ